jgi:hypothetical protein
MEYHKEDVKLGDWVETDFKHVTQVGFITDIHNKNVEIYTVRIGSKIPDRKFRSVFYQNIDHLNRTKMSKENILIMIDLALITGDKEWFNLLSKQYVMIKDQMVKAV